MVEKQQQQGTIKYKPQLLAKELFSPQITKFRRERMIPIYKDETWSADFIDKPSLNKYKTVTDTFTKYACPIALKNKFGISITNSFKTILSEGRKPE